MTKFEYPRLWPFAVLAVLAVLIGGLWLYGALEPARMAATVLWHSPKYEQFKGNDQFRKMQPPIAYVWPSGRVTWEDGHRPRDFYNMAWRATTIPVYWDRRKLECGCLSESSSLGSYMFTFCKKHEVEYVNTGRIPDADHP